MSEVDFFNLLSEKSRNKIYGFTLEIDLATCSLGIGPYGCGVCRHVECQEYELQYRMENK